MSVRVEIVSLDTVDSSGSVVIVTENRRVLVDTGEGTQRLIAEHKIRLSKLAAILITEMHPSKIFGLPGLSLTMAELANNGSIAVNGPDKLSTFFETTSYFMRPPNYQIAEESNYYKRQHTQKYSHNQKIENSVVTLDNNSSEANSNTIDNTITHMSYVFQTPIKPGKFDVQKAMQLKVPKGPLFGKLKNGGIITLPDGTIVHPDQVLGPQEESRYSAVIHSFDNYSSINSRTITLVLIENEFLSSFCQNAVNYGRMDCIVHMSSKEIVTTVEYKSWMDSFGTNTTHIFIGKGMNSNESSYFAATKYNNKLNTINSTLFPKLFLNRNSIDTNNSNCSNSTGNSSTRNSCTESIYVMGKPLLKYHMTPLRIHGLEYNSYDDNTIQKEVNEFSKELINRYQSALDDEINLVKLYSEALLQIDTPRNSSEELLTIAKTFRNSLIDEKLFSLLSNNRKKFEDFSEIKLKFLGTGCSLPSKYRNVSGILLSIPNYSRENRNNSLVNSESNSYDSNYVANYSILLDVGEGTWYQLVRLYLHTAINTNSHNDSDHSYNYSYENSFDNSYDNSNEMVTIEKILAQEIRIIWISHPHADHHLGLVTIIKRRKELCDRITFIPLLVIAPPSILAFLQDYCSKIDSTLTSCYVGLSTRQFDNNDDCIFSDNYWLPDYTGDDHFNTYSNTSTSNGNSKSYSYAQTSDRSGDNNGQSNPIKRRNWLVRGLIPESIRSKAAKDMEFGMKVLEEVGIVSISNTPVIHCPQSYGISIDIVKDTTVTISNSYSTIGDDHNSDAYNSKQVSMSSAYNIKFNNSNSYDEQNIFRVVYSGDTRPTYELVRIGMEADVLVHEATFENDMREEAVLKNHSTIAEAMEIGGQMNAKRIVLTHFSQRYPSMPTNFFHHDEESMVLSPKIINSCNSYDSNSGRDSGRDSVGSTVLNPVFAFDFMNLSMRDLLWAPTLTKALTMAFPPDTTEELETEGDL